MRHVEGIWILAAVLMVLLLGACSPYAYMPARASSAPPPPAEPGAAQAAAGAPVATPEVKPDLGEQVKILEGKVAALESRLAAMERTGPAFTAAIEKPAPVARPPAAPAPGQPPAGAAEDKTFSEAMRLYQAKKYTASREKFHQYLKSQPQGARAPDARFYLGDSFYQEKRYKEAAVEFNKLITQHPKSRYAPAALLRQAYSYNAQGQAQNYKNALKKLVQAYPQSPEAKEAQKYLKSEGR